MGITINDAVSTDYGVSVTGLTATIRGNYVISKRTVNNVTTYIASANVYYTKDAAINPIKVDRISIDLSVGQLAGNIFSLLYANLKSKYRSTIDC